MEQNRKYIEHTLIDFEGFYSDLKPSNILEVNSIPPKCRECVLVTKPINIKVANKTMTISKSIIDGIRPSQST